MTFEPDFRYLLDVLDNRRPARLPVYEHIISPIIMEQVMGVELGSGNSIPEYVPVDGYLAMLEAARRIRAAEQVAEVA